jgi:hypothetical protein
MLIQWRASSQCSVWMSSPSSGRVAGSVPPGSTAVTIRILLLIFLRLGVYQRYMNQKAAHQRPDIVAATRGGDNSLGMEGEADLATATLEQALFWKNIYTEILAMEESVLERIHQLMADQSPQARREVALTNVPVVVAQAERFRSRLGFWETACRRFDVRTDAAAPVLPV